MYISEPYHNDSQTSIFAEQVRLLSANSVVGAIMAVVGCLALTAVNFTHAPAIPTLLWIAGTLLLSIARVVLHRIIRKRGVSVKNQETWAAWLVAGCCATGISLGMAVFLFMEAGNPAQQLLTGLIIITYSVGSLVTLSPLLIAFVAYATPIWLAWAFYHMTSGNPSGSSFVIVALFLIAFLVVSARRTNAQLVQGLVLTQENRELIANLRQSEDHAHRLMHDAAEMMLVNDMAGNIVEANQMSCEALGYSRQELLTLGVADLSEDYNPDSSLWKRLLPGQTVTIDSEIKRKDGSTFPVEANLGRIDLAGTPHISALLHDVTEQRRAAEETRRALAEAEAASRAKTQFLSSMSHELRTPLNAILGYSQLLLIDDDDEPLSAERRDQIVQIELSGRQLLSLIGDLLDLPKIESGDLAVDIEPVDVGEVVGQAIETMTPMAYDTNVTLAGLAGGATVPAVNADRNRLLQVLLNLLSNAIKYNRDGGSVSVACAESTEGLVRISVTDTGKGIAREHFENLFRPFDRLGAEASGIEGTGIGLSIARRLIELMGGEIGVESDVGKGSTFWVDLPRAAAANHANFQI
jgi:PAS domain S-box-containing protein